jgi:hypothetical protein
VGTYVACLADMLARIARFEFTVFEISIAAVVVGLIAALAVTLPVH